MIKTKLLRKLGLGLFFSCVSLFCAQSQAGIIASYVAGASVEVSATSSDNEFFTELFFTETFIDGLAAGDASGSGDSGIVTLGVGDIGTMSAAAEGEADVGGFAGSIWSANGFFAIDNTTGLDLTVDVTFDISWFATIFTTTAGGEAYATAGVYIEDSFGNIVFEDYIEVDSLVDGTGGIGISDSLSFDVSVIIADGDYEEYFLIVDAFGFAESVPEPSSIFLAGFALMFMVRKRYLNRSAE